jgi:hypothetical protein
VVHVQDAFMTPITRPSPSRGIAPQLAARGIAPQTAFTSRRRPPTHMESAAPPSSLWIDKALRPIVGAAACSAFFFL